MGAVKSRPVAANNNVDKNNDSTASGGGEEIQRAYRNSMRNRNFNKSTGPTSKTLDLRQIRTSRLSEKPKVTSGTLWEDPVFPREMAMGKQSYHWMRPKEFCKRPTLVDDTPSRHDVIQGSIGNCWMMAILAAIADHMVHLLKIVISTDYDPNSSSYNGVFHCRLWHQGEWVDIYIDDCLPVKADPSAPMRYSLIGARSPDQNVLWVALLEKALAKFHGSYESMAARDREYGWRLLSGGVPTIVPDSTSHELVFNKVKSAFDNDEVITCSNRSDRDRLHAYTVTGVRHHSKMGDVIRLRNPWGEVKPGLVILPSSEGWSYSEGETKKNFECGQGEFWVSRWSGLKQFCQFCVGCFKANFNEENGASLFIDLRYTLYGAWKGETAAGQDKMVIFKNPKYQIKIPGSKTKKVLIEMIPRPEKADSGISIFMYKITKLNQFKAVLCQDVLAVSGDRILLSNGCPQYRFDLDHGMYMAVPLTQNEGDEREFCLRVFSDSRKIECRDVSGVFFHQQRERPENGSGDIQKTGRDDHYPGLWKNLHGADESITKNVPQYHIKVSDDVNFSVSLTQEYTSSQSRMVIKLCKISDDTPLPLDKEYIDKNKPLISTWKYNIQNPSGLWDLSKVLAIKSSYVLCVFPYQGPVPRHFVLSIRAPASTKVMKL